MLLGILCVFLFFNLILPRFTSRDFPSHSVSRLFVSLGSGSAAHFPWHVPLQPASLSAYAASFALSANVRGAALSTSTLTLSSAATRMHSLQPFLAPYRSSCLSRSPVKRGLFLRSLHLQRPSWRLSPQHQFNLLTQAAIAAFGPTYHPPAPPPAPNDAPTASTAQPPPPPPPLPPPPAQRRNRRAPSPATVC